MFNAIFLPIDNITAKRGSPRNGLFEDRILYRFKFVKGKTKITENFTGVCEYRFDDCEAYGVGGASVDEFREFRRV
ncbi:MAG: hypothetical protein PHX51_04280 [Clostridia bacterium]|nr:hypothetical protein [Clostridia bacterium]